MTYSNLISIDALSRNYSNPEWAIFDCRFSLAEPDWGRKEFLVAHIPGALYAHLDEDLSGPISPGVTGRHPLPEQRRIREVFSGWGIGPDTQVVAYDDAGGSIAARLWWMLKWQGHDLTAVLDGGWQAWRAAKLPTKQGSESRPFTTFEAHPRPELIATTQEVEQSTKDDSTLLIDSRAADRFRGENETLDSICGRIPGAVNYFYGNTLNDRGLYSPPAELHEKYRDLLGNRKPEETIFYCGSGVSAGQNLLAMAAAGLDGARLYPGSWSEWITDPNHVIVTGAADDEEEV